MMGNFTVILACGSILIATLLFCQKRWSQFDLVDLYILYAGIYFGAYPFVKAWLEDYSRYDPWTIMLVCSQIILTLAIIWISWRFMPENLRQPLELRSLFEQWTKSNSSAILFLLAAVLIIKIVGYEKYNIISHVDHGELLRVGKPLPYWLSSTLALLNDVMFCIFIGITAKIVTTEGRINKLWIIPLTVLFMLASIYGRRPVLNFAIIGIILVLISRGRELFQWRYLKLFLALSLMIFVFSNIFQSYRSVLQSPDSLGRTPLKNPLTAALDAQATVENLKIRPTVWDFNYAIIHGQRKDQIPLQMGGIFWQSLKNSIPKVFWPGKEIVNLNDFIAKLYGLRVIDYGKNNYAFAQADFGYFSIIILPIMMILAFVTFGLVMRFTKAYPTLLLLLSGFIIHYLINVEGNIGDLFLLYRNIILISIIYIIAYQIIGGIKSLARSK